MMYKNEHNPHDNFFFFLLKKLDMQSSIKKNETYTV